MTGRAKCYTIFPMTFTITVHGDSCKELTEKLEALADERLRALGLQRQRILAAILVASLPDERQLGLFDPQQRLIILSERFVEGGSWEDVSSVFLHELAHALDLHRHGSTGHTPLFRKCCADLGLDPGFSKSKVKVRLDETEGKREKIRKLMALSGSSTYENEAAEAIRKARKLMLECGEEPPEQEKVYSAVLYQGRNCPSWTKALCSYVAETCGVFALFDKLDGDARLRVFGSLEEVEFAVYLTSSLLEAADREILSLRSQGTRISRPAFLYATLRSLREKTYDKEGSTALLPVAEKNEALARRLVYDNKLRLETKHSKVRFSDLGSYRKGQEFGKDLDVAAQRGQKLIARKD